MAMILDGKRLAEEVRGEVRRDIEALARGGVAPGLAVVLVGDDPASAIYVRHKGRACAEVGIRTFDHRLPASTSEAALLRLVAELCADDAVDGILVQLPLPRAIEATRVIASIDPRKDVDGFHPENLGLLVAGAPRFVPCTPAGSMRLVASSGARLEGAEAVVVGRSNLVGKPVAALLLAGSATVTIAHSRTQNLAATVARAEIVVVGVGRAGLVRGEWIREGAVVIDVGINRTERGLVGDVEFAAAARRAGAITPVPGGVGPMTIAMLCANTARAARLRRG